MGISNFETVMEKSKDMGCCSRVNVQHLAEQYMARTGRKPVLVIDGTNFVRHFYSVFDIKIDYLCGGQLRAFTEFSKDLVNKLRVLKIEPIFFFDGPTMESRLSCRKLRNMQKIKKICNVFDSLENDNLTNFQEFSVPPVLISVASRFIFKYECNCTVYVPVGDCDAELADYAYRESCFGVFSQDSDFVCMKNATYYFSIKHFNLHEMTTLLYDRNNVVAHYSMTEQQMWLFASLSGNDVIPQSKLKLFHQHIGVVKEKKDNTMFTKVADFVKKATMMCPNNVEQAVPEVVNCFKKYNVNIREKQLRTSLRSYQPSDIESWVTDQQIQGPWLDILEMAYKRHVECDAIPDVYCTLVDHPYEIGVFLEKDLGKGHQESSRIFLSLRRGIYSILLHEKPSDGVHHQVKEFGMWNYKWHNLEIIDVPKLRTGLFHPGLIVLWSKDTLRINLQRWTLFTKTISPNLDSAIFYKLSIQYVVPVAVLLYLKNQGSVLLEDEIDSFIKQAVTLLSLDIHEIDPSTLLGNHVPSGKMVNLSTLFGYGISIVLFLLSVLGFPLRKIMPWYYFDGPLFHYFLINGNCKSDVFTNLSCHLRQAQIMEDFNMIKNIVTTNSQVATVDYENDIEQ